MVQGRWYPNGLLNMFATVGGRTRTTWAAGQPIYVAILAIDEDPFGTIAYENVTVLSDVIGTNSPTSAKEPKVAAGYFREPLKTLQTPSVESDLAPAGNHVSFAATTNIVYQTVDQAYPFVGYWAIIYVDSNVGETWGVANGTHYAPTGTASGNNRHDNVSQVLGYMPFVDADGLHSWGGTGNPTTLVLPVTGGVLKLITDPP